MIKPLRAIPRAGGLSLIMMMTRICLIFIQTAVIMIGAHCQGGTVPEPLTTDIQAGVNFKLHGLQAAAVYVRTRCGLRWARCGRTLELLRTLKLLRQPLSARP